MRTLKYFLEDAFKQKAIINQLYFIGALLQANFNNIVFVKLDSRYADYFPEYSKYFRRSFRLLKSVYVMTSSRKLFADELTEFLLEAGFIQYQCQMSIFYKHEPDRTKTFVLSYVDDCVYWYTSESLGKWFVYTLGKIFRVNLLRYAH